MEKTIKKNYVYQGKVLNVRNDEALSEWGTPCRREIVEHHGGAGILAVEGEYIYLVKQYRYAYGEYILEIPAGKLEKGEKPYKTAMRELPEEIGKKTDKMTPLGLAYPTPGYSNEIIYLYLATSLSDTATNFDDDECITTQKVKLSDAIDMILNGKIVDGKTIIAILKYKEMLNQGLL